MTTRTWKVELEDGAHTVQLEHGYFSGKRTISVDGQPVVQTAKASHAAFDVGSQQAFTVAGHPCEVRIETPNGLTYRYDLIVDGRSVTTGQAVGARLPMPTWAWIFIVLCGLIPVVTLGGIIPIILGVGGAFGCRAIASNPGDSQARRIGACLALTVTAWVLLALFVVFQDRFLFLRFR